MQEYLIIATLITATINILFMIMLFVTAREVFQNRKKMILTLNWVHNELYMNVPDKLHIQQVIQETLENVRGK